MLPLISIECAIISCGGVQIYNDLNLKITEGEHWAFIGESGSGKTLLLQIIAGNVILRQGNITRLFPQPENLSQQIALVAAKHSFRNLSNKSNLYYQQRYNSSDANDVLTVIAYLKAIETQFTKANTYWTTDTTIQLLKLSTLADKELIKLSNGETKRLLIAAALLKNPSLLLLDNPLAGLDAKTRLDFDNILNAVIASGITIVMTTSAFELPNVITHIGIINNSKVNAISRDQFMPGNTKSAVHNLDFANLLNRYPSPAFQNIVNMKSVNIQYGEKQVLRNLNWQIKQGEHWALLGPNGAGKSTLLSLINGDNPQAYANNIVLFDRKRGTGESIWDIKIKTGFISPELCQYFPADTLCLQAVESGYYDTMGLFRLPDPAKVNQALQWLKLMSIDKYAYQPLRNMPAGAQRLCLLARAMIKCPTLLILDEPCQGMDDQQIQHFKAMIDNICRQTNITLIYVSHYAHHIPDCVTKTLKLAAPQ